MFLKNFLGFLCTLLITLFDFVNRLCFRLLSYENTKVSDPSFSKLHRQGTKTETEETEVRIVEYQHTQDEEESNIFSFEFQFPSYDEFIKAYTCNDNVGLISNYCEEDFSECAESLEVELYAGTDNLCFSNNEIVQHEGVEELNFTDGTIKKRKTENDLADEFSFSQEIQLVSESEAFDIASSLSGFLSETDFETAFEHGTMVGNNARNNEVIEEEKDTTHFDDFDEECKESNLQDLDSPSSEMNRKSQEEFCSNDSKVSSEILSTPDPNKLNTLWEHHDLIKQLKTELKRVRSISLPTILEEDESQKVTEDFRLRKFEEKFRLENTMSELHKFHQSYSTRMRKFDSLNYQKMYAIGFLQSKDPFQALTSTNPSSPTFLHNFYKSKRIEMDPTIKFMRELHTDLETIYVAQVCLSWEILHWQYEKALELCDADPYGIRKYNKIVGDEFQQFQVVIQRFLENEPFEGPRVQNYIKNRCVLRNLIQVPDITEDNRQLARKNVTAENAISSDMLVEIMEESIRVFWRFVRADKDAEIVNRWGTRKGQVEPANSELLAEVQASLQKKEKKVKDMLRSGKCIIRKFQSKEEDGNEQQVLYFFSQVDMKKLHVEPSFSLFPCC
ncbi:hypothetical protein ACFE04_009804 [Oxalis oulophora]